MGLVHFLFHVIIPYKAGHQTRLETEVSTVYIVSTSRDIIEFYQQLLITLFVIGRDNYISSLDLDPVQLIILT